MQVAYKEGEVYLANWAYLREVEVLVVAPEAKALKIRTNGSSDGEWCGGEKFHAAVKCRLGHYEYQKTFFGKKRVFIRD